MRDAKQALRQELGAQRRAVPAERAAEAGAACASLLLAEPALRAARRVALYAALPDELPTRPLFEALRALGTECLFPRTLPGRRLEFAAVARWAELRPGRFGIAEPPPEAAPVRPGPGDWVVVPGVAFDRCGWRLGRGAGYYDRIFARLEEPRRVGLCYALQLVAQVPHDSHDRPVDAIVTERGWLWAAPREGDVR